jgi:hypothetical protein
MPSPSAGVQGTPSSSQTKGKKKNAPSQKQRRRKSYQAQREVARMSSSDPLLDNNPAASTRSTTSKLPRLMNQQMGRGRKRGYTIDFEGWNNVLLHRRR